MSDLKMKTFDVHNNSPIVSRDSYSGSYRGFQMSYECMVEIRQLENILKSEVLLVNSISRREKKLAKQLEIQTKRVENLKKMFMYGDPESWIKRTGDAWNKSSPRERNDDEMIRGYKHPSRDWIGTVVVGGKLARSCQAIDQELEKQMEEVK